jgi:hypothetical protein
MSEQITISGHGGSLIVHVSSYERPGANDPDDANWLTSDAAIKVGVFSGEFRFALTTHDLIDFHEALKTGLSTLSGVVPFRTTERDIALEIIFDQRGTAAIKGSVEPQTSLEASLCFRFDTDQSYLTQTLRQLEAVLRKFPLKQTETE